MLRQPLAEQLQRVYGAADEGGVHPVVRLGVQRVIAAALAVDALHLAVDLAQPPGLGGGSRLASVDDGAQGADGPQQPLPGPGTEVGVVLDAGADHGVGDLEKQELR